jgi:hypothetical protein
LLYLLGVSPFSILKSRWRGFGLKCQETLLGNYSYFSLTYPIWIDILGWTDILSSSTNFQLSNDLLNKTTIGQLYFIFILISQLSWMGWFVPKWTVLQKLFSATLSIMCTFAGTWKRFFFLSEGTNPHKEIKWINICSTSFYPENEYTKSTRWTGKTFWKSTVIICLDKHS